DERERLPRQERLRLDLGDRGARARRSAAGRGTRRLPPPHCAGLVQLPGSLPRHPGAGSGLLFTLLSRRAAALLRGRQALGGRAASGRLGRRPLRRRRAGGRSRSRWAPAGLGARGRAARRRRRATGERALPGLGLALLLPAAGWSFPLIVGPAAAGHRRARRRPCPLGGLPRSGAARLLAQRGLPARARAAACRGRSDPGASAGGRGGRGFAGSHRRHAGEPVLEDAQRVVPLQEARGVGRGHRMSGWTAADLLPGLYVILLGTGLAALLRRWYDPLPWRILAVFGLLLVLLFGTVLFGGAVLLPLGSLPYFHPYRQLPHAELPSIAIHGDLIHQIAPWSLEVRRALWDGRWPLWNAGAGAGMPLLADPQAQAFQPLVVAAYLFPIWPAAGITAALRVLVALVFGFLLLRSQGLSEAAAFCGSLAFGLGGFLLLWLGWPMANCAALLPPVLYGIARCDDPAGGRDLLLLFLATVALLLAGHPETLVYAAAFAGLFLLDRVRRRAGASGRRRLLLRGGLAMALAGGVAAPVLLPALDYLPKTERAALVAFHLSPAPLTELWRELMRPETLELW